MILLPMVYSLNNLCENIATLLTQSKLISRVDAVEMVVALKKGHLPGQMGNVTSVVRRSIFRKTAGQQEMVLAVTNPSSQ